jgi:DNA polymerase-1
MVEYRTLADMTLAGMLVDEDYVRRSVDRLAIEEEKLKGKLLEATGVEFNPDSPQQVSKILFEDLRFPVVQTTKSGQPSTGAPALRELRQTMVGYKPGRDLLDDLIRYREVKKMAGTYLLPYLGKHRGNDGRIHPTIYITRTGRLSMSNPNLQNVPRDATVKGSFVPTDGYKLFDADYAQVELRVAAFLAEEDGMLSSFSDGLDIHTATLAEIEGLPYLGVKERVESGDSKWKRKRAEIKAVNFLILYGGGPYQLVSTLRDMGQKVSLSRAKDTIDRWFKRYWRIAEWIERSRHQIIKDDGAVNIFGQVRHLPGAGLDSYEGQKALRQGVNFLVQSVAAKFALMSLPFLQAHLSGIGGRLLLTVHDSIVGEYPDNIDPEIVRHMINESLTTESIAHATEVFGLDLTKLPLAADTKMGLSRWG